MEKHEPRNKEHTFLNRHKFSHINNIKCEQFKQCNQKAEIIRLLLFFEIIL